MSAAPHTPVRRFELRVARDIQDVLRALGPFAVQGLALRFLLVDTQEDEFVVAVDVECIETQAADWLCRKLEALPCVISAKHLQVMGPAPLSR